MNVLVFGATGMIGQGVVRECVQDSRVERVVTVVRRPSGDRHARVMELVQPDVADLAPIEPELENLDACFFCLGVSALGMSEADYTRATYDLTLRAAQTLAQINPGMTFIYVSGAGTDSTEHGRMMWARVKGRTENALLELPFKAAYMFRPGMIMPLHGIRSRTTWYNAVYAVIRPFYPLIKRVAANSITTTQQMGRAMLEVAEHGYPAPVLETADINSL